MNGGTAVFIDDAVTLYHGDCRAVMASLGAASVDAIVTDPPYELGFMGKRWDASGIAYDAEVWQNAYRALKPGGHLLAFGGTRTWHRLAVAIEDAGFEIRDNIARFYGDPHYCGCELPLPQMIEEQHGESEPQTQHNVRSVRHGDLPQAINTNDQRGQVLQSQMPQHSSQATERAEPAQGAKDGTQPGMERRSDLQATEGQLQGGQVRASAGVGETDGAQGRLHHGTPTGDGDDVRSATDTNRGGEPQGSQPREQSSVKLGAVPDERGSQARRSWPLCARCGKPIQPTSQGSLAWVMGSGFPKSLDVSKAIDKKRDDYPAIKSVVMFIRQALSQSDKTRNDLECALGGSAVAAHFLAPSKTNASCPSWQQWQTLKTLLDFDDSMDAEVWRLNGRKGKPGEAWAEREVVGQQPYTNPVNHINASGFADGPKGRITLDITAPATPAAQQWQGWGTALKPAFEPIVVARKPLDGTVAENVLRWGTGALNIDGSRIGTTDNLNGGTYSENYNAKVPDGDQRTGASLGMYQSGARPERPFVQPAGRWPANVILDESQAAELDRQSGVTSNGRFPSKLSGTSMFGLDGLEQDERNMGDQGGASRFFYVPKANKRERPRDGDTAHPTVKPLALMRYLVKLVTPPGGTVLEPFAGSGTTAEACVLEGFRCIAIEMTDDYLPLIIQRLERVERGLW